MVEKIKYNFKHKKSLLIIILIILILFILLIVALYTRAYMSRLNETRDMSVVNFSSCFSHKIIDELDGAEGGSNAKENLYPMSDWDAIDLEPFYFSILNNCDTPQTVHIVLITPSTLGIPANKLKVSLNEETPALISSLSSYNSYHVFTSSEISTIESVLDDTYGGAYLLKTVDVAPSYQKYATDMRFRMWISSDATTSDINDQSRFANVAIVIY